MQADICICFAYLNTKRTRRSILISVGLLDSEYIFLRGN